jgi:hypothetical protein
MNPTELTLEQSLKKVSYKANPAPYKTKINVPYADKDTAKALGAKWDKTLKSWYIEPDTDMNKFNRWLKS